MPEFVYLYDKEINKKYYFNNSYYQLNDYPVLFSMYDIDRNYYFCYCTYEKGIFIYTINKIDVLTLYRFRTGEIDALSAMRSSDEIYTILTEEIATHNIIKRKEYTNKNIPEKLLPKNCKINEGEYKL